MFNCSVHTCVKLQTEKTGTGLVIHKAVQDWKECPKLCHQNTDCHSWSWVSAHHAESSLHFDCNLFSASVSDVQKEHHVSGMKDSWSCLQTTSHNIAGVDIQGDLNIAGLLGGHDLKEFKDILYKSRANIITGVKTFTDVTVDNDIVHDGKVNGLSDLKADLLFLDDTKTAAGEYAFSEVEMKNLQVNGLVDGVNWSNLLGNRLLRDAEQTISATYTFGSPNTKIRFHGDVKGNDGDEDNAELNGQKISAIRTAETVWPAVAAVKVAAQAEANVLCHHVKDLNKAYLRNLKVDLVDKLDVASIDPSLIPDFQQVLQMDTLYLHENIYLVVLCPSRLITAKVTDSSIKVIQADVIKRDGSPITSAYDFIVASKEIRKANDFSFFIASTEGLTSFEIDTNPTLGKGYSLDFGSFPFRMAFVEQTQSFFVAIQDQIEDKFQMRIVQLNPPVGSVELWKGEKYSIKMTAPDFDLIMIKEKLYFAISDRQNHKKLNYLSFIEVDVTYPSQVHFSVNNTITVPISDHDFLLIAPRHVPLIVASKPGEVSSTLFVLFIVLNLCAG